MTDKLLNVKFKGVNKFHYNFKNERCVLRIWRHCHSEPVHIHDFDELVIISSGSGIHIIDNERYPIIRGDVFVVCGNHRHGFINTKDLCVLNLLLRRDYLEKLTKEFSHLPGFNTLFVNEPRYRKNQKFKSKLHLNSRQLHKISELIDLIIKEQNCNLTDFNVVCERIFDLIIVFICRYYSKVENSNTKALLKISNAIDFMETNFGQPISVALLAKKSFMAESNFRHSFKKVTGLSPVDFLIKLRIQKATEIIDEHPDYNVTEVLVKTGFENSSYFTKKFKEIVGITPMAYLKEQRTLGKINEN